VKRRTKHDQSRVQYRRESCSTL